MAVFAKIENNVVVKCIVISDEDCGNQVFPQSEPIGQTFISSLGLDGQWIQTSPEGLFRGSYAGQDWTYDSVLDIFVAPVRPTIS